MKPNATKRERGGTPARVTAPNSIQSRPQDAPNGLHNQAETLAAGGVEPGKKSHRSGRTVSPPPFLSIVHISSPTATSSAREKPQSKRKLPLTGPAPPAKEHLKIWTKGARADVPGIPNRDPKRQSGHVLPANAERPKRGPCKGFSAKSQQRLKRHIAKINVLAVAFTMVLTLPGCDLSGLGHPFVMAALTTVLRRLSANKRFAGVSGYWKREIQKRGAVHYHLVLFGLENPALRVAFHAWMVAQWTACFASGLTEVERENHRRWHARSENMRRVGDFFGYFAKSLGKHGMAAASIPGLWWGCFNKKCLPFSPCEETEIDGPQKVKLHRLARKRREKAMDDQRAATLSRLASIHGTAHYSQADLWRLGSGYVDGGSNPTLADSLLADFKQSCKAHGIRTGKFRFRGRVPNTAPIILCGRFAPAFAAQARDWLNSSLGVPPPGRIAMRSRRPPPSSCQPSPLERGECITTGGSASFPDSPPLLAAQES